MTVKVWACETAVSVRSCTSAASRGKYGRPASSQGISAFSVPFTRNRLFVTCGRPMSVYLRSSMNPSVPWMNSRPSPQVGRPFGVNQSTRT